MTSTSESSTYQVHSTTSQMLFCDTKMTLSGNLYLPFKSKILHPLGMHWGQWKNDIDIHIVEATSQGCLDVRLSQLWVVHSPGTFYWFPGHHCCYVLFHNELLPYLLQKTSPIHRTYCQDPQLLHHLPNPLHQPWFHQLLLIRHCQPTQTVLSWCLQTMRVPSNQAHLEGSLKTALQRGPPQKAFICSQFRNHASTFSRVNLLWWPPFWSTTQHQICRSPSAGRISWEQ